MQTLSWICPVRLQGQHVSLIPLSMEHCSALIEACSDGELWKLWYAMVPAPEEMESTILERLNSQSQGLMLPFTVIKKDTQTVVGMTSFMDIENKPRRLEIGNTWYRKSAQKTAVNTETRFLLLQHAFEVLDCVVVRISTNNFNMDSRRAIERLGAKLDGILRNHRQMRNGALCDSYTYSIIQSEWPTVKIHLKNLMESYEK